MIAALHVEVDGKTNVFESHDMIDNLERRLRREYGIEATIHMDPIVTDDEMINTLRGQVEAVVCAIDDRLRIHDFRFVTGQTHSNLIFDVVVPFEVKKGEEEIRENIETIVKTIDKNYYSVVNIDKYYV